VFKVHAFADQAVLPLPLGGVDLEEALLDGARAYPVPAPPPRVGYLLPLAGRGNHTVRLVFGVRVVQGQGDERELRWTVPEVAQSWLSLDLPAGTQLLSAVPGRGAQGLTRDAQGLRVTAELGRGEPGRPAGIAVRWQAGAGGARPPVVRVKELHWWRLRPEKTSLTSVLQYAVSQGATGTLRVALPEDLEVEGVEADQPGTGLAPVRLKGWEVTGAGGQRRLRVEFQTPVTGEVQVTLTLTPRLPLRPDFPLTLPQPQDAAAGGGLLAYRVEELEAALASHSGVTRFSPHDFAHQWGEARGEQIVLPSAAYSFQRPTAPLVQLRLAPLPGRVACAQDLTWRVAPHRAEVDATARFQAPKQPMQLLEWEVPAAVVVAEVRGDDLLYWTRAGDRLQAWLRSPAAEVRLRLTGWLDRPAGPAGPDFELPCLRPLAVQAQTTFVRVTADNGVTLAPHRVLNLLSRPLLEDAGFVAGGASPLTPAAALQAAAYASAAGRLGSPPAPADWHFVTHQTPYAAAFRVRPAPSAPGARLLTFAEVRDRALTFVASLEGRVPAGERPAWTLRLRNWDGDVSVDGPAAVTVREQPRGPGPRAWTVQGEAGAARTLKVTLTGKRPVGAAAQVPMPEVEVAGAGAVRRWLAVAGPQLQAAEPRGLKAESDPLAVLTPWPQAADRLRRVGGRAWRAEPGAGAWGLQLRARPAEGDPLPASVFLIEQSAAVPDGRRWVHQATYWLYHERGANLPVVLPPGATLEAASIDGNPVAVPAAPPLRLSLPWEGGIRRVRLSWTMGEGPGTLDRPGLERPRVHGIPEGLVVGTVHVPAGYLPRVRAARLASAAVNELGRAAAHLSWMEAFAAQHGLRTEAAAALLRAEQEAFAGACHRARLRLREPAPGAEAAVGPGGLAPAAWLQELQDRNQRLCREHGLDKLRAEAEKRAGSYAAPFTGDAEAEGGPGPEPRPFVRVLSDQGQPFYWQEDAQDAPPQVLLAAVRESPVERSLAPAGLLGLLVALCLSLRLSRLVSERVGPVLLLLVVSSWCLGLAATGPARACLDGSAAFPALAALGPQALGTGLALVGLVTLGAGGRLALARAASVRRPPRKEP
jgi:hypothetical protein